MRFIRNFILLALLLGVPVLAQPDEDRVIRVGDTLQGLLTEDEMEVAYTFEGEQGQFVTITLVQIDDMDPYLRLEDARGGVLAQDDDSAGSLNSRIGPFRLPTNGIYTIVATSLSGRDVGEFSLSLAAPVIRRTEYGQTITGELSAEESEVEYTFSAEAGAIISIDLTSDEFDTTLTLLEDGTRSQLVYNDDGGIDRNSRIGPFAIPEDGDYQIVVGGFSGPVGEFELTLNRVEPTLIEVGEAVESSISGSQTAYFSFEGQAGDVVDIRVDTGNKFDTVLTIIAPSSSELASDESVYDETDPFLSNQILGEDGTYFVAVQPSASRDSRTPIIVKVTESMLLSLDDGAQTVQFRDFGGSHLLTFTGEADETAIIVLTFGVGEPLSPYIRVRQGTTELASVNAYTIGSELSFGVTIPQDGRVLVDLQDYTYQNFDVTVSVERE